MSRKLAVIAIGGNSLIKHRDKQSVEDQYPALCETKEHIAATGFSNRATTC